MSHTSIRLISTTLTHISWALVPSFVLQVMDTIFAHAHCDFNVGGGLELVQAEVSWVNVLRVGRCVADLVHESG